MSYCLKFPDEATAIAALSQYRGIGEDGTPMWITGSHEHAMAVLGTLHSTLEDGTSTPIDGFHINLICAEDALSDEAKTYIITPLNPKVVWL
jgi:hypothetical protein